MIDPCLPGAWQVRRELAHIQRQGHINHGQEIYCVKLASSVSMLDADRVCSSDRGVVSHLSMPPLVLMLSASNLFFFSLPLFLLPFTYFCEIKIWPSCDPNAHLLGRNRSLVAFVTTLVKPCRWNGRRSCCLVLLFFFISCPNLTGNMFHWWENRKRQVRQKKETMDCVKQLKFYLLLRWQKITFFLEILMLLNSFFKFNYSWFAVLC